MVNPCTCIHFKIIQPYINWTTESIKYRPSNINLIRKKQGFTCNYNVNHFVHTHPCCIWLFCFNMGLSAQRIQPRTPPSVPNIILIHLIIVIAIYNQVSIHEWLTVNGLNALPLLPTQAFLYNLTTLSIHGYRLTKQYSCKVTNYTNFQGLMDSCHIIATSTGTWSNLTESANTLQ